MEIRSPSFNSFVSDVKHVKRSGSHSGSEQQEVDKCSEGAKMLPSDKASASWLVNPVKRNSY